VTLYDKEYRDIVVHGKDVLVPMAQDMGLTRGEAEAVVDRARGVVRNSLAYGWMSAGVAGGSLDLVESHQDLVTHALLMWDGDPVTSLQAAVKPWSAEQYQYANVRSRTVNGVRVTEPATSSFRFGDNPAHERHVRMIWEQEDRMARLEDRLAAEADWAVISERLTPRERAVIAALADGDTQEQAATRLGLTRKAIQVALRKVRDKAEGALAAGLLTASVDAS
jgi:hypothetical protein